MPKKPTFIELVDTEEDPELPSAPVTDQVIPPGQKDQGEQAEERYGHLLAHGTTVSPEWDDSWIKKVIAVEREQGYAICGAKKRASDLKDNEDLEDPLVRVCRRRAGYQTEHSGEGRCAKHGGGASTGSQLKTGQFSLLSHNKLSPRVHDFFENPELLDIRAAIGTIWAAMDAVLGEDEEITHTTAQEVGTLMTRVGNLIKQHEDIQEKRKISIEVPEFMAWAEFFYELAVKYIQESGGDVAGFLRDAQQFYNRTVTIVVGPESRRNRLGAGDQVSSVEDEGVSRSIIEV